jgi:hypothetical protein
MRSVFVPVTLAEAKQAIAMYDLAKFGTELIPIPAMGGCVIAVREVSSVKRSRPRLRIVWLENLHRARAELRLRSVLRTLSLSSSGGDA